MATNDWEKYIQDAMSRWDWNALAKMKEEWGAKQWQEFVKHIKNETIDECLAAVGEDIVNDSQTSNIPEAQIVNSVHRKIRTKLEALKEKTNG